MEPKQLQTCGFGATFEDFYKPGVSSILYPRQQVVTCLGGMYSGEDSAYTTKPTFISSSVEPEETYSNWSSFGKKRSSKNKKRELKSVQKVEKYLRSL
jgi:hypothetical protein